MNKSSKDSWVSLSKYNGILIYLMRNDNFHFNALTSKNHSFLLIYNFIQESFLSLSLLNYNKYGVMLTGMYGAAI